MPALNARRTLNALVPLLLLVLAIRTWLCMPALVIGTSMTPTLQSGQWLLIDKLTYRLRSPQRGEIVCVWTGKDMMVKRVIGLPNDEVALHKGKLYVNGTFYSEPYVRSKAELEIAPGRIPPDAYVVIGDNRSNTIVAIVNRTRIVGKAVLPTPHKSTASALAWADTRTRP